MRELPAELEPPGPYARRRRLPGRRVFNPATVPDGASTQVNLATGEIIEVPPSRARARRVAARVAAHNARWEAVDAQRASAAHEWAVVIRAALPARLPLGLERAVKRGTPPRRRAPLRAGQPSGRAGAARRAPLRPVSARRSAQNRQRRQVLAEMAGEMPWCQAMHLVPHVMCGGRAVDGHERLTRARGGSITDERNIVLLCRAHHDWVGAHLIDAERLGLLAHSWDNAKDV